MTIKRINSSSASVPVAPDLRVDSKGDLVVGTGANAVTNLPVGDDGTVLTVDSTSPEGVKWSVPAVPEKNWTLRIKEPANYNFWGIAYNGTDLYVAYGENGMIYTSPDGKTWTSRTSGFGSDYIYKVVYGNGLWVAVGGSGIISTSPDGITWTVQVANMLTNYIFDVIYANGRFTAVGDGGGTNNTGGIVYSTDGVTWTKINSTFSVGSSYYGIVWTGTNYIIVATLASGHNILYSSDGVTWTVDFAGYNYNYSVWFDGTRIIYSGSNGYIYYTETPNGTSTQYYWNTALPTSSGGNNSSNWSLYNGKMYIAGTSFVQAFSTDPDKFLPPNPPVMLPTTYVYSDSFDNWSYPYFYEKTDAGTFMGISPGMLLTDF